MNVWDAIKNDFIDFVSIIKDDTQKTIIKVLGDQEEENTDESLYLDSRNKDLELIRDINTYSKVIQLI